MIQSRLPTSRSRGAVEAVLSRRGPRSGKIPAAVRGGAPAPSSPEPPPPPVDPRGPPDGLPAGGLSPGDSAWAGGGPTAPAAGPAGTGGPPVSPPGPAPEPAGLPPIPGLPPTPGPPPVPRSQGKGGGPPPPEPPGGPPGFWTRGPETPGPVPGKLPSGSGGPPGVARIPPTPGPGLVVAMGPLPGTAVMTAPGTPAAADPCWAALPSPPPLPPGDPAVWPGTRGASTRLVAGMAPVCPPGPLPPAGPIPEPGIPG